MGRPHTYQNVVLSTTIFTVPGNLEVLVNASSMSMGSCESLMLTSETASSVSTPSRNHGGDPAEERKIPAAAACVSVGELRDAEVIFAWPRELRAMRMCDGLVDIADCEIRSKWNRFFLVDTGQTLHTVQVRIESIAQLGPPLLVI
jgi:hypothetical protein